MPHDKKDITEQVLALLDKEAKYKFDLTLTVSGTYQDVNDDGKTKNILVAINARNEKGVLTITVPVFRKLTIYVSRIVKLYKPVLRAIMHFTDALDSTKVYEFEPPLEDTPKPNELWNLDESWPGDK